MYNNNWSLGKGAGLMSTYWQLKSEFESKLKRELADEEKKFLYWVCEKHFQENRNIRRKQFFLLFK